MRMFLFVCVVCSFTSIARERDSVAVAHLLESVEREIQRDFDGTHPGQAPDVAVILEMSSDSLMRIGDFRKLREIMCAESLRASIAVMEADAISDTRKVIALKALKGLPRERYEKLLEEVIDENHLKRINSLIFRHLLFSSEEHLRSIWEDHPYSPALSNAAMKAKSLLSGANDQAPLAKFFTDALEDDRNGRHLPAVTPSSRSDTRAPHIGGNEERNQNQGQLVKRQDDNMNVVWPSAAQVIPTKELPQHTGRLLKCLVFVLVGVAIAVFVLKRKRW